MQMHDSPGQKHQDTVSRKPVLDPQPKNLSLGEKDDKNMTILNQRVFSRDKRLALAPDIIDVVFYIFCFFHDVTYLQVPMWKTES